MTNTSDSPHESEEGLRRTGAALAERVTDLETANAKGRDSRLAALNLMEDAVRARQAVEILNRQLQESEGRLRTFAGQLEHLVQERTEELTHSEERLRILATELNLAEQRERKRLASELHDYLAQLLVLGRMTLSQAKRIGLPPRAEDLVEQTEEIFGKALTYCRTLMAELSPPILQDRGLLAGLTWLADHMQRHELAVVLDVEQTDDVSLPQDCAVLLFQSIRELLINVAKHAAVKRATVRMTHEEGLLRIIVRDENGFDLVAAAAAAAAADNTSPLSSKFGLFSIRERMRALGGSFDLQSAPGQGTTATLTLQVAASAESKGLGAELSGSNAAFKTQSSALPGRSVLGPLRPLSEASTQSSALQKNARVRLLLVDDHTLMRQGLRSIVSGYAHLEVVGEAGDGVEAVALVDQLDPDVVVMDINMPNMDGIEATRRIKAHHPSTVVIGLSVNQLFDTEERMKAAGAAAYLTKESAADVLCHAIDAAISHEGNRCSAQS